jgi:hypothetical protein
MRLLFLALVLAMPCLASANQGFNPDISVNFLGLYQYDKDHANLLGPKPNSLRLQEAETQFLSDVDPYFRASVLLSVSADSPPFTAFGLDPEEVYAETTSLPWVTLKLGKFKAAIGKNNNLHTHAFPFIDAPLFVQNVLGPEGLSGAGLSAAALMPLDWFSEMTVQTFQAGTLDLFNAGGGLKNADAYVGLAHLKNLFDLGESTTLELGTTVLSGPNEFDQETSVWGADLTLKWRPVVGGKYQALIWGNEYLGTNDQGNLGADARYGAASYLQWQFAERWWLEGRGEFFASPNAASPEATLPGVQTSLRQSILLAFFPSEFSGFRVEYARTSNQDSGAVDHRFSGQINFTIGAHPAHAY